MVLGNLTNLLCVHIVGSSTHSIVYLSVLILHKSCPCQWLILFTFILVLEQYCL